MKKILIVDDSLDIQASLKFLLEDEGFESRGFTQIPAVCEFLKSNSADLILLDMNFNSDTTSGKEGLDAIPAIRAICPDLPIIMMTGWGTIDIAVESLKRGASDFIEKPWNDDRLIHAIKQQVSQSQTLKKLQRISEEHARHQQQEAQPHIDSLSPKKQRVLQQLAALAKSDMNILLRGENGTGKSFYAKYVHQHSQRANESFIAVNLGAISDTLFESEMFGHVKGAFTDAKANRIGNIALADGGTLFLDEIANLSKGGQAKLLHVLEEKRYQSVGSSRTLEVSARIISATNGDLPALMESGEFRQDLYFRLNTVEIEIPPLRACQEDILPLAEKFIGEFSQQYSLPAAALTTSAKQALCQYHWPGNIRELRHVMERMVFVCQQGQITADDLGLTLSSGSEDESSQSLHRSTVSDSSMLPENEAMPTLDNIEEQALFHRLAFFEGNVSKTAKSLGLSRSGWYRRMAKYE
ncbi:sigma-54-dependent transcriptional regulator [Veronia pacifica]|uniref:Sigma-54-dependent Fis family transcriptional regulator n=1 Tax=Veronia pacifica TaxID=1080227 RepID=A0A1C3EPA2_9GAMM|nr:sigma-54 dependent transcriptional regulator [Veronia pacifica]ODA35061.1 sigma-54-dependent Fis family transcriptional regulator [Veronia pacifica]